MNKTLLKRIFSIILFFILGCICVYAGLTYLIEICIDIGKRSEPIDINRFTPSAIGPGLAFIIIGYLGAYGLIREDDSLTDKQGYYLNKSFIICAILGLVPMVIFPISMDIFLKGQEYVLCNERTDITRLRQQTFIYAPTEEICEKAEF
ncbi:MAG: hypothetical protein VX185_12320 [Pseudomonadota bacterium]|nr:hypothetical protein [Pseudomonadota bacterium]HBF09732.1 hypothetical protein [Gammaproteobacteria bacterium]|tara:strand:- start:853 stop:1299 length:447 start_codon:yes stop_codon:yes gene_type:complete